MTKKTKQHNNPDPVFDDTGPSSSQTPYLVPAHTGVQIESILSVGDQVGVKLISHRFAAKRFGRGNHDPSIP